MNSNNIIKIIKNINKYHYYIVNKKKSIFLGSDNSNTMAKMKVYQKLGTNIEKYIGKTLIRIKISHSKKIPKDTINKRMIGGPIVLKLERYKLTGPNKLIKTERLINYFFYKDNEINNILPQELKKLAFAFKNGLYNASIFDIKYVKKIV